MWEASAVLHLWPPTFVPGRIEWVMVPRVWEKLNTSSSTFLIVLFWDLPAGLQKVLSSHTGTWGCPSLPVTGQVSLSNLSMKKWQAHLTMALGYTLHLTKKLTFWSPFALPMSCFLVSTRAWEKGMFLDWSFKSPTGSIDIFHVEMLPQEFEFQLLRPANKDHLNLSSPVIHKVGRWLVHLLAFPPHPTPPNF
jgi:hypothetical protein